MQIEVTTKHNIKAASAVERSRRCRILQASSVRLSGGGVRCWFDPKLDNLLYGLYQLHWMLVIGG